MLRDQLRTKIISNLCTSMEKNGSISYESLYLAMKTMGTSQLSLYRSERIASKTQYNSVVCIPQSTA